MSSLPPSSFAGIGLSPGLVTALSALGYEEPTPIQAQALPPLLAGRDVLGQAATGTGKTAAFALPLLQRALADGRRPGAAAVLVLVPTRELAIQVAEAFHSYGARLGAVVLPIYGGQEFGRQVVALKRGVHVVVATPGRALDHLRRGTLDLTALQAVVLDEADEMLDMGFAEDIELILEAAPQPHQTALFSATLPPRITAIADRHLADPLRILIARESARPGALPRVRQTAYVVQRAHKVAALGRILDLESPELAIVFGRTRTEVDELGEKLRGRGWQVETLHGGLGQDQRDRVMKKVRAAQVEVLVATDVAARGLDVDHVTHVVNFNVPSSPEAYVHRIGRTGRAGRDGVAITLAEPREHRGLRSIEQLTRQKIDVATVPTPVDVRARRLDLTRSALQEILMAGGLDSFRVVADALAGEFDPMDVAAAAVRLAHEATQGKADDEAEIPSFDPGRQRPRPDHKAGAAAGLRPPGGALDRAGGDAARAPAGPARPRRGGATGGTMVRVFIGAGRNAGIRPADLVGAITNEAGVSAREIGAIEIEDTYSLVELSDGIAQAAIEALRRTSLRGQRPTVRRDQPKRASGARSAKPPRS